MKTLQELEVQRDELNKQIEDLKKQSWPNVGDEYWIEDLKKQSWPNVGDEYWIVGFNGVVCVLDYKEDVVDAGAKSIGNMYMTKEEAESQVYALKVIAELKQQPGRKMFEIDSSNYCIVIYYESNHVDFDTWTDIDYGWQSIYFDSHDSVQAAIKTVGADRILKAAKWLAMGEVIN